MTSSYILRRIVSFGLFFRDKIVLGSVNDPFAIKMTSDEDKPEEGRPGS